jgi:hypothetical protein
MGFLLLALALPFLAAYGALGLLVPARPPGRFQLLLRGCLAAGVGLGVTSYGFYFWLVFFGPSRQAYVLTETALLASLAAASWWAGRRRRPVAAPPPGAEPPAVVRIRRVVRLALLAVLALAVLNFVFLAVKSPYGDADARAIWNTRARFFFRAGDHWADAFSPFTDHPDYPLLLPASVARGWLYMGEETNLVPVLVGFGFTFATVGLLVAAVAVLRGASQGFLAGLALLSTAYLIEQGTAQYADVPLGFFFLATMVLLGLHDRFPETGAGLLTLAGLTAGLAAWTKNEGLLFLAAVPAARLACTVPRLGWKAFGRQMAFFCLGLLPAVLTLAYFKAHHAPANDLIAGQDHEAVVGRLLDVSRYLLIGRAFGLILLDVVGVPFALLVVYFFLMGRARRQPVRVGVLPSLLVLVLMLGGYFGVYVITPKDLEWHLGTSLDRLLLQLWPLALFTFFLAAAAPEEVLAGRAALPARTPDRLPQGQPIS